MEFITVQQYSEIAQKIHDKTQELNELILEAHKMGLRIRIHDRSFSIIGTDEPNKANAIVKLPFDDKSKDES